MRFASAAAFPILERVRFFPRGARRRRHLRDDDLMDGGRLAPEGPRARWKDTPWSPTATREEARAYVQDRLNLYSKITALSSGAFLLSVMGMYLIYPHLRPIRHQLVHSCAIGGVAILLTMWLGLLRRRPLSLRALYAIDTFYMAALGAMLGISAYFSPEQRPAVYGAFIWLSFMVYSRVLIVPSTARRTAVITTISFLPIAVASVFSAIYQQEHLEMPPVATVVAVCWLIAWAVTIAANGSKVIYGLRRAVSDAMQLGQYTLGDKIDAGGMGVVYRAQHALLRRPTAIKLLHPDRVGADNLRRFEREVQLTSQLTHPNTVAIFDYGRSLDGVFYYAMEYLDGIDLETLVQRHGPQPPARVVHILHQICGALDEAHALGLIHRDVKPANILLCQRGRIPDVAKIVDFGLVKELDRDQDQTQQAMIAGTPAYISPEAVTDPEEVGPRSDIYGLGTVAYYLLTGQRVFVGKTAIDLCLQHVSAPPPPPSSRIDLPIPPSLEALVLGCLAKAPADRPADARTLAAALEALADVPGWNEDEALGWWREHGATLQMAAARPPEGVGSVTIDMRDRAGFASTTDPIARNDS